MEIKNSIKPNKHGFTLSELLVVIVIMMILAGVSFVAVSRYIRNLHVLEMDNTAKEIFIVAQNHLSKAYASGEFERELEDQKEDGTDAEYFGKVLSSKPSYILDDLTGVEHEYRYVIYNGHSSGSTKPEILSSMLPVFSIDKEISENGNYIIVYDAKTATVLGVFYSGNTHTYFGSSPVHDFEEYEAEEKDGNTDLFHAVDPAHPKESMEKRKHYPDSTENAVIGRYVSGGRDAIPEGTLEPIILKVTNGAKLTAEIINPNYKGSDNSKIITLTVKGKTSGNSQTLVLGTSGYSFQTSYNNVTGPDVSSGPREYTTIGYDPDVSTGTETFTFILDDITQARGHFCNAFPYLIPGEDVEIYAEISDTASISTSLESNHETVNSLFDGFYSMDSDGGMAEVKNIRHLENLTPEISNLSFLEYKRDDYTDTLIGKASDIKVTNVNQIADISYSESGSFVEEINKLNAKMRVGVSFSVDGTDLKVYYCNDNDGITLLSQQGYYGVSNSNIVSYDGLKHEIKNIHCETGANGNTGIFAEVKASDETKPFLLKNLTVKDSVFKASETAPRPETELTSYNAGGLVGCNLGHLSIQSCKIESSSKTSKVSAGNGEAGGMVGYSTGNLLIEGSDVKKSQDAASAVAVSVTSNAASSGCLVGHSKGTTTVKDCVVDSDGLTLTVSSGGSGNAAGLIGHGEAAVSITKSYVYGENISISSASGNAAGLIGYSKDALTVTGSSLKGHNITIASTSGDAGGLAGKCDSIVDITEGRVSGLKDGNVSGSKVTITASSANAGGLVGETIGTVNMVNSYSAGDEFTITAQNGGGIIGKTTGTVEKMELCYASGKNYKITGTDSGGIIGVSGGGLEISNTYSSAYIVGTSAAGGFIGEINGGSSNLIENCYASGHTKSAKYGKKPEDASSEDYYNVISDAAAGGFIGSNSVTTNVKNSYTTCSVYSTSGNPSVGYAGGFAGIGKNSDGSKVLDVNNCYSAGLVSVASGGTAGGFFGKAGTTSGLKSYYLRGNGFNSGFGACGSGTVSNIEPSTSTSTEGIAVSGTTLDAVPWDESLVTSTDGKANYPYKTVAELSGNSNNLSVHNGDWAIADPNNISLRISNAEKLSAILVVPTVTLQGTGDHYASMVVQGMKNGKIAYMLLRIKQDSVSLVEKETAINSLPADSVTDDTSNPDNPRNLSNIVYPSNLNYKITVEGDNTLFHIYLDDVTKAGCNFAALFIDFTQDDDVRFTPGEDLRIAVTEGVEAWGGIIDGVENEETSETDPQLKSSGITNSLFADGSGNNGYSNKSYYSDINADTEIIAPSSSDLDNYEETAFILNFRHLQNLDKYVSGVGDIYKKAKLCRNLYWNVSNPSGNNTRPEGQTAFTEAIRSINGNEDEISIYPYNETAAIALKDSFCGIINENIREFDGGFHSIDNLLINNRNEGTAGTDNKLNSDAGLFRFINNSSGEMKIHDLTMIEPVVITANGSAGGLIGNIQNGGTLKLEYVYIYGKDSIVRTLSTVTGGGGPNAGGLIGTATLGGYTINDCGASAYVYSSSRCAGGFIGDFKPKAKTDITDCFVGGHVKHGTNGYEYVDNEAVTDDVLVIQEEGGYNVCGFIASGGFVGFLGTDMDYDTTITRCFTTASVHAMKTDGDTDLQKGVAGGFVGRIQKKKQKYEYCYVAGKIFAGQTLAGGFIGHHYKFSEFSDDLRPKYTEDYVLHGYDFNYNETTPLPLVGFGTSSGYTVSGVDFAEHDYYKLVNDNSDGVNTVTFAREESEHYPYKDSAMNTYPSGTGQTVFYGDWVEPDNLSPVKIINGNRLIARINLRIDTCGTENINGHDHYVTYIRLKGQLSGAEPVFRVYFGNGEVHVEKLNPYETQNIDYKASVDSSTTPSYLDFCIDNVSVLNGNYYWTMRTNDNEHEPKPGENFTIYASRTLDGAKSDTAPQATANSLFQRINEIKDGTGTGTGNYTAYIANSRHLMNINSTVSNIDSGSIRVTEAVQTDNIYWIDDGTYAAGVNYKAVTPPYQTELESTPGMKDARIYVWSWNAGTSSGEMMSLASETLGLYDGLSTTGDRYSIYNAVIGKNLNDDNSCIGLFSSTRRPLTIQNLVLMRPRINYDINVTDTGILVGLSTHELTVNNLSVYGDIEVSKGGVSGVIVGRSENKLTIDNVNIEGNVTVTTPDNDGSIAGGLVGQTRGVTSINAVTMKGNITISSAQIAGGLVGKVNRSDSTSRDLTIDNVNIDGNVLVTALRANESNAGGLVGQTSGITSMNAVTFGKNITVSGNKTAGGLVGKVDSTGSISNDFTIDDVNIDGNVIVSALTAVEASAGGLVGQTSGITSMNAVTFGKNITVSGNKTAGGLVGEANNSITITHSAVTGAATDIIKVTAVKKSGGIIGEVTGGTCRLNDVGIWAVQGVVSNTFVNAYNNGVGGFIGELSGTTMDIKNCFASIYVDGSGKGVGGFIGNLNDSSLCTGTIQNCYASGHTALGGFVDSEVLTVPGHINVIGELSSGVGGFIGYAVGGAGKVNITKCFSTNSVKNKTTFLFEGGFAGVLSDNVNVSECYTISKKAPANAISFAGSVSGGASVSILDNYTEEEANRCDAVHNDATVGLSSKYPYKNWTDKSGSLTPGSESNIVFYGDWVD